MTLYTHPRSYENYVGDGSTVAFVIPFAFLKEEHLDVHLDAVLQDPSTYSISDCHERPGDNGCAENSRLVFTTAPETGVDVVVIRKTPITNESDWRTNLKFQAEVKERALDKLTMILQELNDKGHLAVRVMTNGPKAIGGGSGLTFRKLVDVRPAQLITNPGSGRYTFLFVGYDKTGSQCFGTNDPDTHEAYENNLCTTVPTFAAGVRNYVLMYTFQTGGTVYYRFSSGSSCLYGSACGGPWNTDTPSVEPDGSTGNPVVPIPSGGPTGGGPESEWYQYARCSDPATGIGWHNELGSEFYYDQINKTDTGRPICYQRMSAVPTVSVTPPGDIIQDVFWVSVTGCDHVFCQDCVECVCGGGSPPTATIDYTYCNDAFLGNTDVNLNLGCKNEADGAATLGNFGAPCKFDGTVAGWVLEIKCDSDTGMWYIKLRGSTLHCWAYRAGDDSMSYDYIPVPEIGCSGNKPDGAVILPVAVSSEFQVQGNQHNCGTVSVTFS